MMGGHGMMGGRMGLFDALDLTDEQQTKINKIQDETRKLHWSMMGEMMTSRPSCATYIPHPNRIQQRSTKPIKN